MVTGPRRRGDVPVVDHPPPGSTRSVVTRVLQRLRLCTAASGGQTVLANNRNGRRLRLIAARHYCYYYYFIKPVGLLWIANPAVVTVKA